MGRPPGNTASSSGKRHNDEPGGNHNKASKTHPVITNVNVHSHTATHSMEHEGNLDCLSDDGITVLGFDEASNRFIVNDKPLDEYPEVIQPRATNNNKSSATANAKKPPPIVVVNSNASTIQNLLNSALTSRKFEIKLMRIGIKIQLVSKTDFDHASTALKTANLQFYSYHSADTRQKKIVLYGLYDMNKDELVNELKSLGVAPDDVKQLRLRQSLYSYDTQAVYLLYFKPNSVKLNELREIRHLFHVAVKWDFYRPKAYNKIPQCRNCQMFGHSSVTCNIASKCLVCAQNHATASCDRRVPKDELRNLESTQGPIDRSYIKCANCGLQHTANYKGCSKRVEYEKAQSSLIQKSSNRRQFTSNNRQFDIRQSSQFPPLNNEGNSLFTGPPRNSQRWSDMARSNQNDNLFSAQQLMAIMRQMMPKLMRCRTKEDQIMAVTEIITTYVYPLP